MYQQHIPARRRRLAGGLAVALTSLATLALTTAPASAAPEPPLLQYGTTATQPTHHQSEPWFRLTNQGSAAIPLAEYTIRYYFRAEDGETDYRYACSWATPGCDNLTGAIRRLPAPTPDADHYLEVGFRPGAGDLGPGHHTGDLQLRFHRANWGHLTQSNDYSFNPAQAPYGPAPRTTLHRAGQLLSGAPPGVQSPAPAQIFFDDFHYDTSADARLNQRGWTVRTGSGGPGVGGATWDPALVTFPTVAGQKVAQLSAQTNGTPSGTRQSQINTGRKFYEGTYATRFHMTDAPAYGPDGDHVVQTFYTITPLRHDRDPDYGEQDFEYLPNGGWGESTNTMFLTSWETYQPDPWWADNSSTRVHRSFAGWHDLVLQVSGGRMKYYLDGHLVADHGDRFYPETPMLINFNHWFIDLNAAGPDRRYHQQADWIYFARNQVLSPAQVQHQINTHRAAGTHFLDTVPAS
ncbi:cellulose binding domain-containing protein [Crossiella sp. CA198]|uniref:cellulose binding domain-containing protein n=1 Tax=Crossiella sp. CA198 TaxID=3455607 RepID=UPI003F8D756E